jgi:hypothetical protein
MTWEQVEVFYTRKLRRGKLLSMRVPFRADVGAQVTLGLELPNRVVIPIDGRVLKAAPLDGEPAKTSIEIELVGFTDEVVARLKSMMAGAAPAREEAPPPRPPPPSADELPTDEHRLFMHLGGELRRLRQLAVHDVLGVDRDADAEAVRIGWMGLVRRYHPDLVARHHAPAISHLAEELTILCNRAYDRLRAALVLEGRATAAGSVLQQPAGWLVGFDDLGSRSGPTRQLAVDDDTAATPAPSGAAAGAAAGDVDASGLPSVLQGGETFESRARLMLSNGEADNAQEVLAAALCVYPRSRPLRSLYYVASALAALMKGERMLATSQLETALAHYENCVEAAQILDYMSRNAHADHVELRRFFR